MHKTRRSTGSAYFGGDLRNFFAPGGDLITINVFLSIVFSIPGTSTLTATTATATATAAERERERERGRLASEEGGKEGREGENAF